MSRLTDKFEALNADGKTAFVTYTMSGDPDPATSLEIMRGLPGAGVDIIELGLPFTDPMADGPSIQKAALRALDAGPLHNSIALESITPVLLHLNRHYKGRGCGLRITGLPEGSD